PEGTMEADHESTDKEPDRPSSSQLRLDQTENLSLTDDHRFQAAGHPENMGHRIVAGELVRVASPGGKRQGVRPPPERLEELVLCVPLRGDRVELRPVAGRQQNAALDQVVIHETAHALALSGFGNEYLFPDGDRGG